MWDYYCALDFLEDSVACMRT